MTTAPDNDDDDFDSSAADEPTAMWGADALKDLGLEEAAKAHEEAAPVAKPAPKPATAQPTAQRAVMKPKTVPKKRAAATAGPSVRSKPVGRNFMGRGGARPCGRAGA